MILYMKEVASYDQIYNSIERIGQLPRIQSTSALHEADQALLIWLNCICAALQQRILLTHDDDSSDQQSSVSKLKETAKKYAFLNS